MDRSKHTVTIPVEDYAELMKLRKNQVKEEDLQQLSEKASAWQIYNPGPSQPCQLHISTKVPYWFNLGEIHVYQDKSSRVMKKYKLIEIEDNRLDIPLEPRMAMRD